MDQKPYLPIDDAGPVGEWQPHADHVDDTGIEKETRGQKFDGPPGTQQEEVNSGGYNNIWDDSYPVERPPRPVSGSRGGPIRG